MKALQAICAVSAALAKDGISKDRNNAQQGYKFRGIDDCLNALAPLMASHGLVIIPECLDRTVTERETRNGGSLFYVTVRVKYRFYATEDASTVDAYVFGEAMDSADKATNKAMSAAYKYAVIQTFCIPTEGDNDADATTHEVKAQKYQQNKAANAKKFAELRVEQDGASTAHRGIGERVESSAHGTHQQSSDAAPPSISDETWQAFYEYMQDDPDRSNVGKQLKSVLKIVAVADLRGLGRSHFIGEFQKSCKETGVPCSQWM